MTDENLQYELNTEIKEIILNFYQRLVNASVDSKSSTDLIITSLASNLGTLLSTVPDQYREEYLKFTIKILENGITNGLKNLERSNWGQIGHA